MSENSPRHRQSKEHAWFYKPPTSAEVDKYGAFVANAMAKVSAERKSSRVFSMIAATATGAIITAARALESGTLTLGQILPNFLAPIVVNTVSQLRSERIQRRNLNRLEVIALAVKGDNAVMRATQMSLESEVRTLRAVIEASGLKIPEVPEPRPPDEDSA